jgi:hypothetical protein
MRWVWTVVMALVVASWIWDGRSGMDAFSGSLLGILGDWLVVTLVGVLAAAWHVYCVISDRGRPMPLWSAAAVAILVAALKSCEIALADRRAARA